jgi:hypothetical protein
MRGQIGKKRGQSVERFDFGLIRGAALHSLWLDVTQIASAVLWDDVSLHEPGRPTGGYFPD